MVVVVLSTIRLADVPQRALQAMPRKDREKFIWDMRCSMLFQDANFQMEPGGTELNTIQFTREIYYDGLTKNKLIEVLSPTTAISLDLFWNSVRISAQAAKWQYSICCALINLK
jgi:hypothetical protein